MIYGIGCDLCALPDGKASGPSWLRLCGRVFGPAERTALALDTPLPAGHSGPQAGQRGGGFCRQGGVPQSGRHRSAGALCPREIEAVRLESGAPAYRFSGASARSDGRPPAEGTPSLSHDGGMALAFCILETAPKPDTFVHTME